MLICSGFVRYDMDGHVLADSRTFPARPAAGQAIWSGLIGPHHVKNVGSEVLHILAVEIGE
ncbi:hypothetical protein PCA_03570 [Rhodanobacter sp. PCA2]|nr:hypothetical protein [Rhodanobacter sp. PCA2]